MYMLRSMVLRYFVFYEIFSNDAIPIKQSRFVIALFRPLFLFIVVPQAVIYMQPAAIL